MHSGQDRQSNHLPMLCVGQTKGEGKKWQIYPLMRSKFQPTWMSSMVRIESNLESPTYNTQQTIIT